MGVERLKIVKLKAEWVKNPDIELKNIEILVGDNYNLKDLIDKVTVTDNNITKGLNEANGDYTVDFEYDSIDNNKPGTYPVDVIITTANGGKARGKAFVIVKEKQSTLNEPEGETKEVFVGDEVPEAKSFVKDFENLPERTEVAFKETPSTETAGEYEVNLTVTYPDGTTDDVTGKLIVKEKQSNLSAPEGEERTVFVNDEVPEAKSFVKDFDKLPEGTTVSFKETPSTQTAGEYEVNLTVTYPDGTTDDVTGKLIVKEKQSNLSAPEGEEKTVFVNDEVPEAKSFVKDFENLPEGTTVSFVETPSTEEAGEYEVKLTVTYPDGTTDEVVGKLIVKAKPNTSDPSDPETPGEDPEVPGKDQSETPKDSDKEDPILPGTPDEDTPDLPKEDEPGTSDNKDEDERVVVPSPDNEKPEDSEEPGTPDKTEDTDDIEESEEQETTDGKDDGDKVIVPTPDNKKPEDSEESGTTDKSETPDKSEESESQDTTDKKDDDGKIRVPSINKDNEPDDRHSSSKIKQSSESSIISADDNNTGTNVTRSPRSGHDNVQTGVSGAIGVASILAAASLGLAATKKKEDEEE